MNVTMVTAFFALVMYTLLYVHALPLNDTSSIINVTHVTKLSPHIPLGRRHRSWWTGTTGEGKEGTEGEDSSSESSTSWTTSNTEEATSASTTTFTGIETTTQNTIESGEEELHEGKEEREETSTQDDSGANRVITTDTDDSQGEMIEETKTELNSNEIAEETTTETLDDTDGNQMTQETATMDTELSEAATEETTDSETEQSTPTQASPEEEETKSEMEQITHSTTSKYSEEDTSETAAAHSTTGSVMKDDTGDTLLEERTSESFTQSSTTEETSNQSESTDSPVEIATVPVEEYTSTGSTFEETVRSKSTLFPLEESTSIKGGETIESETTESTTSSSLIRKTTEYDEECEDGFRFRSEGDDCVDINECELNANICREDHECFNTDGSYLCIIKKFDETSTDGSTKDATSTNDLDTNEFCEKCQHICTSSPPSPLQSSSSSSSSSSPSSTAPFCSCYPGYQLKDDLITCIDVDECAAQLHNCRENSVCVNREGSYDCNEIDEEQSVTCEDGYTLLDEICQDIDECTRITCPVGEICRNLDGTYTCEEAICLNENQKVHFKSPSEFECICKDGFELTQNASCVDVDECALNLSICGNGSCINTLASYECKCPTGYKMDVDTCVDINECIEGIHRCPPHSTCINDIGFHHCQCPHDLSWSNESSSCVSHPPLPPQEHPHHPHQQEQEEQDHVPNCRQGFIWSSQANSCLDIDECSTDDNVCSSKGASFCVNLPGSFDCLCQVGYTYDEESKKCAQNQIESQQIEKSQSQESVSKVLLFGQSTTSLTSSSSTFRMKHYSSSIWVKLVFVLTLGHIILPIFN